MSCWSPFSNFNLVFRGTVPETARDEEAIGGADFLLCPTKSSFVRHLGFIFMAGSINSYDVEYLAGAHGRVLRGLDGTGVRIVEISAFANKRYEI